MKLVLLTLLLGNIAFANITCEEDKKCTVEQNMTFWGFDLYHLKYELDKNKNEHLTLTYLRDISKEDNVEKGDEKFKANNLMSKKLSKKLDLWHAKYIDVIIGDKFEIIVDVKKKTTLMVLNKKELIEFKEIKFGSLYLNIWAGNDSVDSDVRDMIIEVRNKFKY